MTGIKSKIHDIGILARTGTSVFADLEIIVQVSLPAETLPDIQNGTDGVIMNEFNFSQCIGLPYILEVQGLRYILIRFEYIFITAVAHVETKASHLIKGIAYGTLV